MFVFTGYKTFEIGVNSLKYGFIINGCGKNLLVCDIKKYSPPWLTGKENFEFIRH